MKVFTCAHKLLGLAVATALFATTAHAQSYTFTNISDTTGGLFNLYSPPQLNDAGLVAFGARSATDNGYFTSTGGPPTTIFRTTTGYLANGAFPAINNAGTVAFDARFLSTSTDGVFVNTAGTITPIATASASTPYSDFGTSGAVSINAANTVLFHANLNTGNDGIFTSSAGVITTIADSTTPGFTHGFNPEPALNASGTVAFVAPKTTGITLLRTAPGGSFTTIADTSGPFTTISSPSINSLGIVAFKGFTATTQGIFTGSGGAITTIADTSGPFSIFLFAPQINDLGEVAFDAQLTDGTLGIFTGPNPTTNAVIKTGDSLFGGTVTHVEFYRGLDNLGNIAFSYEISKPGNITVDGIALAKVAVPVPEPTTLTLLACASALCFRRRRQL